MVKVDDIPPKITLDEKPTLVVVEENMTEKLSNTGIMSQN
jgi:hypothetical protein